MGGMVGRRNKTLQLFLSARDCLACWCGVLCVEALQKEDIEKIK